MCDTRVDDGRVPCPVLAIRAISRSVTHDTSRAYVRLVHSRGRSIPYGRIPAPARPLLALHSANFCLSLSLSPFLAVVFRSWLPFKRAFLETRIEEAGRRIRVQPFLFDTALGTAGVKTCLYIATAIQHRTYKAAA